VTINKLVTDKKILERYLQLAAEAYVADNTNVRWCPGKSCNRAIRVQLLKEKEIVCECGQKFWYVVSCLPRGSVSDPL